MGIPPPFAHVCCWPFEVLKPTNLSRPSEIGKPDLEKCSPALTKYRGNGATLQGGLRTFEKKKIIFRDIPILYAHKRIFQNNKFCWRYVHFLTFCHGSRMVLERSPPLGILYSNQGNIYFFLPPPLLRLRKKEVSWSVIAARDIPPRFEGEKNNLKNVAWDRPHPSHIQVVRYIFF